jgi:hypothetical protein
MTYSRNKIFFIIFLGFISSVLLSNFFISKYDTYNEKGDHILLKDETLYHWYHGARIVEDVKNGENFFLAGRAIHTKPLPQRLVAIYSLVTGFEIVEEWEGGKKPLRSDIYIESEADVKIRLGGKLPFLILQSLLYYSALIYLFFKINKFFPIRNCFYIILFLSFEQTLFQYHSSFWTESFYFSMQILLIGLLFNYSKNFLDCLLIGLLIGIMFLQRSVAVFYFIPIIIYFAYAFKFDSIKPIIATLIGYGLIASLVGMFNYNKTSFFYIFPSEGKRDVYNTFSLPVIAKANNISVSKAYIPEIKKSYDWLKENNIELKEPINLKEMTAVLSFLSYIKNENDKIRFYNYLNLRQYQILLEHPVETTKRLIKQILHFSVFDPVHNYYYNEHRGKGKLPVFVESETHHKWVPYRIVYSFFIYIISFIGLIYFISKKNYIFLSLLILSILYNIIVLGWIGWPRFVAPNLIYLSFLFGNGIVIILNYFNKKRIIV